MPDQIETIKSELSHYQEQLESDNLTPEQQRELMQKISRLKVRIFLNGVEEEGNDT